MGLLNKILKSVAQRSPRPSEAEIRSEIREVAKDGRLHVRHQIPMAIKALVHLSDGTLAEVVNLSYGGLGIELLDSDLRCAPTRDLSIDFVALGFKTTFKVDIVRVVSEGRKRPFVGMAFCHESPDILIFLRILIDGMRYGSSMAVIPPEVRKTHLQGPEWRCLRGDGPCDLTIRTEGAKVGAAIFTFPYQGSYAEVSYTDGQLATREAVTNINARDHRPSQLMQTTSRIDLDTLRRAAWILASIPQENHPATGDFLKEILTHLT